MQPKPASGTNLLALPEGTELVGDYRIKRVLGAGGFGITYLAEEIALGRLVTIKEYFPADFAARLGTINAAPRSQGCAEDFRWGLDRFISEAQTLARFVHPNIVGVYRYFLANDTGYMVICFEEGGSFKSWLGRLKRAPRQAELDRILTPLLEALEFVHKANFLHRDIAPDNIIIRKDGSPVLIDFGSARGEMVSHSRTVSALVKPGYSPYEQYATTASMQGPWTDIYALGATLYHAITGKRPPDSPSRMVSDEYIAARQAALSSYRASFLTAIDQALNLEVTERPQSIAAWRGTLLAPDPKRAGGGLGLRLALVRTLGRKRSQPPAAAAPGKDEPEVRPPDKEQTLVPLPPDAPQPQGQLLDFIDALKNRRPQRKAVPKLGVEPAAGEPVAAARRKAAKKRTLASPAPSGSPPKWLFGFATGASCARGPRTRATRCGGKEGKSCRQGARGRPRGQTASRKAPSRAPVGLAVAAVAFADLQACRRLADCLGGGELSEQAAFQRRAQRWRQAGHRSRPDRTPERTHWCGDGAGQRRCAPLDRLLRRRCNAQDLEQPVRRAVANDRPRRGAGHRLGP